MREETPSIEVFVSQQFPNFYQEEGQNFIAFVRAYYEWLGEDDNTGDITRRIYNLRDVDRTIDDFVIYFKTKYLANFGNISAIDARKLVKHSGELFSTKGTEQGYKLLFQLLYGEEISVYYPGNDVLKASDGKWKLPMYLEVSPSETNTTYLYKQIVGTESSAKAFVDGIVRRFVGGRMIDIFYLSSVRGNFKANERITADGNVVGSPVVLGSLSAMTITDGGAGFTVGQILDVSGGSGVGGKVRVESIENATGKVNFTLLDGGSGYRLSSNVLVSNTVLKLSNLSNTNFSLFETVSQNNHAIGYIAGTGTLSNGSIIRGTTTVGNTVVANGIVLTSNSTKVVVNTLTGNFSSSDNLYAESGFSGLYANTTDVKAYGKFLGYSANNSTIGLAEFHNPFYVNGEVVGETSGITANVATVYAGTNANFAIGSIGTEDTVTLYTDLLASNNAGGVPFLDIVLSGSNANTVGNTYGFPKPTTGFSTTIDSIIANALDSNTFTIGTIASLSQIKTGQSYNANPFIVVYDPLVAAFDRRNIVLNLSSPTGSFLVGEDAAQTIQTPSYVCNITSLNANTFAVNDGVTQATSNAQGTVVAANSSQVTISSFNMIPFEVGKTITSNRNNAQANTTSNTYAAIISTAKGKVIAANTSTLVLAPKTLSTLFDSSFPITGLTSNATASIVTISFDETSNPMGLNAKVSGKVVTANGVLSRISIKESGFGFVPSEAVTLSSSNPSNPTASATVVLDKSGIGEGFWRNTDSFLDSDKKLHDNDYYQAFSYEIKAGISLDKYSSMLKKSFHLAGMKLFGSVIKVKKFAATETKTKLTLETTP